MALGVRLQNGLHPAHPLSLAVNPVALHPARSLDPLVLDTIFIPIQVPFSPQLWGIAMLVKLSPKPRRQR